MRVKLLKQVVIRFVHLVSTVQEMVIGVILISYALQGKYGHKKQVSAGSESDKKTVGRLSDHTGDDQNNSNEHHEDREDTPAEEVSLEIFF